MSPPRCPSALLQRELLNTSPPIDQVRDWAEGKHGGSLTSASGKVKDIMLYYPAGTRWWWCRGHHGNAMKMPWQHHSNCGLICSLVVWYSPDLLQWCGRQIHTSVTSLIVTLFINYFISELIDHHQQSVKRSKNTVSTGLCFLLSERRTGVSWLKNKVIKKEESKGNGYGYPTKGCACHVLKV